MAQDKVTVTFKCDKCGNQLSWDDELPDSQVVTCSKCGSEVATLTELKAEAIKRTKAELEKRMRDVFKGAGWKMK